MLAVLVTTYPPIRLSAQVEIQASLGARYTSTLVTDRIVTPFDVRPAIGPALAVSVVERTRGPWAPDVTLDLSWSGLQRHDSGRASQRINRVTALAFTVGLRRRLAPSLAGRVAVGGLKYLPGDETGIFRDGAGIAALGSAAVDWTLPFAARRRLGITAQYDLHRFITPALRSVGFVDSRLVHRLAFAVRVSHGGEGP